MSLARMMRHRCDVERATPIGAAGKKVMQQVATNVPCLFIPLSAQASIDNQINVGYGWNFYAKAGADIQVGDRLTWDARTYIVRGRMAYTGMPARVNHLNLIVTTERSNGQ